MKIPRIAPALAAGATLLLGAVPASALLPLESLVGLGYLEVALDTSRFPEAQVATIRVVNVSDFPIEGTIPGCVTVFEPKDSRLSPLAPRESGRFTVGARQTIQVTRLFRLLEPGKRPPDGGAYELSEHPLRHDLSKCPR